MNRLAKTLLLCIGVFPALSLAAPLKGQVSFTGADSNEPQPDYGDTVVFFRPDALAKVQPTAGAAMTMVGKSFSPHVLAVTVGSSVRFPNGDPIFHNAFSPSAPNDFDLGLYDTGDGKTHQFQHPGLVHVYCNVHRDMFAYVLVLDTPYFAKVQDDGSFDLLLPAGAGELTVWNPRTQIWHRRLPGSAPAPLDVQLVVNQFGVPEHMNKEGKPYGKHRLPGG